MFSRSTYFHHNTETFMVSFTVCRTVGVYCVSHGNKMS